MGTLSLGDLFGSFTGLKAEVLDDILDALLQGLDRRQGVSFFQLVGGAHLFPEVEVLVRAKLALSDGVTMQVTVRAENPDVSELITSTIG